jgi:hypothetical protein
VLAGNISSTYFAILKPSQASGLESKAVVSRGMQMMGNLRNNMMVRVQYQETSRNISIRRILSRKEEGSTELKDFNRLRGSSLTTTLLSNAEPEFWYH